MTPVCLRHRSALVDGLRALWSEIAARNETATAPAAHCSVLAAPLADLAARAGYPLCADWLRDLARRWSIAAPESRLSIDESLDFAAWCDTLVIGLEEGLDRDGIELLISLDSGSTENLVDLGSLAEELSPGRPLQATSPAEAPAADSVTVPEWAASAPDRETAAMAEAAGAGAQASPEAETEGPATAPSDGTDPLAPTRSFLLGQGIDLTDLSATELLQLAEAFGQSPVPTTAPDVLVTPPDPAQEARRWLAAQGIEVDDLPDLDVLELARVMQGDTEDLTAVSASDTREAELAWGVEEVLGAEGLLAPEAPEPVDASTGTIWIAEEELALTRSAITEQVMPGVVQLVDAAETDTEQQVRGELGYQLGLIANALQLFGISSLDQLLRTMAEGTLDRRLDGEALIRLSAALLSFLDHAEPEAAGFLAAEAQACGIVDADYVGRFEAEALRVRIGMDPALIAARKRTVEAGDLDLQPAADVLPDVLNSMLRELPGNAARLGQSLRALVERGELAPMDEARRIAHTLKGDANTVGVRGLANLTHSLEDALIELLKDPGRLSPALGHFLLEAADLVEECADHLLGRGPAPATLGPLFQQALDWSNRLVEGGDTETEVPLAPARTTPPAAEVAATEFAKLPTEPLPESAQTLAVDTRLLDELQRLAGELTILSRQVEQRLDGLLALEREMRTELAAERNLTAQLDDLVALRGAALQSTALSSNPEVDALELDQYNELHTVSRRLSETHGDNEELVRRYARLLRDIEPLRGEQQRLNEDLQRTVARTRTLPFGEVSARLQRVVRQTARQVGKNVELQVDGESIGIDAELLERLVEPLSHLLRNAIDHGIEISELRRAAGKPERGHLRIRVAIEADRALIELRDDGRGLDLRAIRAKALQLNMVGADTELGDDELAQLILAPGFSTRDAVSQVSGRGVGLDVVNQRIQELRGSLAIQTESGRGTCFSLRLPLSRSLANVVVVEGHGVTLAVVASAIQRIVQLDAEAIRLDERQALAFDLDGQRYAAQPIETLFDRQQQQLSLPGDESTLGLLIELPGRAPQLLCVQRVGEITRAVVKSTSPLLPPIPAVRGITQLGDGRLAPVVDIDVLLQRRQQGPSWQLPAEGALAMLPRVVVADDSLSVRRALEQLMQDAGYEVAAARDGLEALQLIQQHAPVAVLLDLEMPRMNGLEVCRHLRSDSQTRETPVVMITSRASDKYRLMAEEAGVSRLLGKPFSEDELVNLVRDLVAANNTRSAAALVA